MTKLLFYGFPRRLGGANVERYHTGKLLSEHHAIYYMTDSDQLPHGDDITIVNEAGQFATMVNAPSKEKRLEFLADFDGIVIGMCSQAYRSELPAINKLGLKHIWVPCMCYIVDPMTGQLNMGHRPTHTVFQSNYQALQFAEVDNLPHSVIHGLFSGLPDKTPKRQTGKTILKLCRADRSKFPSDYWEQCQQIYDATGYRTRVVGIDELILALLGEPPDCVEVHKERSLTLEQAFDGCSYLFPGFGSCAENWPQVAYEAIAHGCLPVYPHGSGGADEMPLGRVNKHMGHLLGHLGSCVDSRLYHEAYLAMKEIISAALQQWLDLIERLGES